MKVIDLSVSIVDGLPVDKPIQIPKITYYGHKDPFSINAYQRTYEGLTQAEMRDGAAWATETISLHTHTGTHLDAPWHFHPTMNGGEAAWTIDEVPLEWCMGPGVVVDFSDKPSGYLCQPKDFQEYFERIGYLLRPGDIVLLRTNAMRCWGTPAYLEAGCGVGREATLWLAAQGIHTVGTDAWSWDIPPAYSAARYAETCDPNTVWEGHKAGADCIYIQYEKLTNLECLPVCGFQFFGVPVKIHRASAGWTRAFAIVEEEDQT